MAVTRSEPTPVERYVGMIDDLIDAMASDPVVTDAEYYEALGDIHGRLTETLGQRL